ncbi:MAG: suppressor of fused domain protein [Chloroflexi bacterium]|nr:suppressor of fused domain protein [Chloroflexota bacterium]OJV86807.1 MAG: hypothetical protein BGO39_13305 [Chloroflexi bacterium 54-19]
MEEKELNWGLAYFDRFVKLFGNPINQQIWDKEGYASLQILTFAPSSDLLIFASIGLTLYPERLGGTYEVFLAAADRLRDAPNILGRVLTIMLEKTISLGPGAFYPIEKMFPDFSAATGKTALYFTDPAGLDELATVRINESEQGKILVGMFISAAELAFLEENGATKFEEALTRARVDPADMNRKSIF